MLKIEHFCIFFALKKILYRFRGEQCTLEKQTKYSLILVALNSGHLTVFFLVKTI